MFFCGNALFQLTLSTSLILLTFQSGSRAQAAEIITETDVNDWNTPCFNGTCQYALSKNSRAGSGSGILKIWGFPGSISDITPASGWMIMNCTTDSSSQSIRLVCTSSGNGTGDGSDCDHLYGGSLGGAEGKIVRLPEDCGTSAFARITRTWIPEDQSIPPNIAKRMRLGRRDGEAAPQVKALSFDTNFSAIDVSKVGKINFAIQGSSSPPSDTPDTRFFHSRGLSSNDFNVTNTTALPTIDISEPFNLFNESLPCLPVAVTISADFNGSAHVQADIGIVAQGTIVPPSIDQFQIIAGMNATLDGGISLDLGVSGSVDTGPIPLLQQGLPLLSFTDIFSIGPVFELSARATASLDSDIKLDVGVNWSVNNAQIVFPPASANDTDPAGGTNATDSGSDSDSQQGVFQLNDTPLNLSVSPSIQSTGSVSAHLIPSLNLGISAFDNTVSATVFVDLDASATLTLTAQASEGGSGNSTDSGTNIGTTGTSTDVATQDQMEAESTVTLTSTSFATLGALSMAAPLSARAKPTSVAEAVYLAKAARQYQYADSSSISSGSSDSQSQSLGTVTSGSITGTGPETVSAIVSPTFSTFTPAPSSTAASSSLSVGGCVEFDVGFNVNAGVQGNFFDIFDNTKQVSLFDKEFTLFKKCFGDDSGISNSTSSGSRKRAADSEEPEPAPGETVKTQGLGQSASKVLSGLSCLSPDIARAQSVLDQTITAASAIQKATKAKAPVAAKL